MSYEDDKFKLIAFGLQVEKRKKQSLLKKSVAFSSECDLSFD